MEGLINNIKEAVSAAKTQKERTKLRNELRDLMLECKGARTYLSPREVKERVMVKKPEEPKEKKKSKEATVDIQKPEEEDCVIQPQPILKKEKKPKKEQKRKVNQEELKEKLKNFKNIDIFKVE